MDKRNRDRIPFASHHSLYMFTRISNELMKATETFQKVINMIVVSVLWKFTLLYLDDPSFF